MNKKNQKGIALLMTMMLLTSALVVALSVADILFKSLQISKLSGRSSFAYLASEAGTERMLWEIRKNNTDVGEYGGVIFDGDGIATFDPDLTFTSVNLSLEVIKEDIDIGGVAYSIATSTG